MSTLHPRGVNHLAISTTDMKRQLSFWCDALGLQLKALYWMHGVDGAFHGFVELAEDSYVAFVQHPDNDDTVEFGVSHADGAGGGARGGTMQHVALHVDTFDELTSMRDRLRSKGVQVIGPIDHGFVQSIYFEGPEGLNLEVATGAAIDDRAWVDPEVVGLCGIDADELAAMLSPAVFVSDGTPVTQPTEAHPENERAKADPDGYAFVAGLPDEVIWESASETEPPVQVDPS